jgi:hypothetical protein
MGDNFTLLDRPRLNEDRDTSKKKGGRWYLTPRGDSLPSVTTVLKVFPAPQLDRWIKNKDKEGFANWVVKNRGVLNMQGPDGEYVLPSDGLHSMLKALNFYDDTAALTGNLVHNIIENKLLGRHVDVPPGFECVAAVVDQLLEDYEVEVVAVEPQLINYTHQVAGSADAILRIRKRGTDDPWRVIVVDWKSGNGLYGSVARQLCMYARMEVMLDPRTGAELPMPHIDGTAGVWVRPSGYALYPMQYDEEVWIDCRAALRVYHAHARGDWGMKGRADNPNPIKSKGRDWPALPKEESAAA